MSQFISTISTKLDAKQRVSVPAQFRMVAAEQGFDGIFVYPSFTHKALDAGGQAMMDAAHDMIAQLDPYSEEHHALATALFADSHRLPFDSGGRVSFPSALLAHADIKAQMLFVGLGQGFQIWSPALYEAWRQEARQLARANRSLLRPPRHRERAHDDSVTS